MATARAFPWLVAIGAAIGVYVMTRPALAAAPKVWTRSVDNWMAQGATYRWSAQRYGTQTPAELVTALQAAGFSGVKVWQDSYPADWPADDRALSRNRFELTVSAGPIWIGNSVMVWSSIAQGAPVAPPASTVVGNRLALLAQGTVR